ncbi:MAG: tRNA (cytidine(56)-2'-O)-methyltransferase [Candidatus Odinarchaeum yellowstonii]|uniref:tRNA (cytidine(56)-2'-O)-methyltransferase n=1 Tax=Odinarchaeota yellowstonii (strain LCB_4) TaxID=1841599 RepID=A0AAF0D2X4_ODILC|nr:MAG: tRNA (cytidine(56)-2'-O)-methyltransferase [Candidatus Odinarchaeum yellowstonii]
MIGVLRLNHRFERDKRVSTHVFLTARALGADLGVFTGDKDESIINSLTETVRRWGGGFKVEYSEDYTQTIREFKNKGFKIVHLTMYGIPVKQKISELKNFKDILLIVGGAKVPREVYDLADYNISIGSQPHSEVAALAIFLHEYYEGRELDISFPDARLVVEPQEKGKKVLKRFQ